MCTKHFCWNVCGFNIFSHRNEFKKWLKVKQPIFRGLIETHIKQPKNKKFINELLLGWSFKENYGLSNLDKIWVIWHPSVKVAIITKSLQMITCQVFLPETPFWIIVYVVYVSNDDGITKELWEEIFHMASSQAVVDKLWIVLGDFNQVLKPL